MSAEPAYNVPVRSQAGSHSRSRSLNESQIHKVLIQDADRFREFDGYMMYRVSTEVPLKPQWLEIEIWKVMDGTCRYVLHFVGRSVLVHKENSDCNTGVPTPAIRLAEDSEACRKCRPDLAHAKDDDIFEAETDRHKIEVCDGRPKDTDPASPNYGQLLLGEDGLPLPITDEWQAWVSSAKELLRILRESWHRKPETAGTLSAPAQRLVDTAARMDDAILAATQVVESL